MFAFIGYFQFLCKFAKCFQMSPLGKWPISNFFLHFLRLIGEQFFDHAKWRLHFLSVPSTEKPYACAARQSVVPALDSFMSSIKHKSWNHNPHIGARETISMFNENYARLFSSLFLRMPAVCSFPLPFSTKSSFPSIQFLLPSPTSNTLKAIRLLSEKCFVSITWGKNLTVIKSSFSRN